MRLLHEEIDWLTTTIKKPYFDQIENGTKKVEFKGNTEFWRKRLKKYVGHHNNDLGINLLCGRKSLKFIVPEVEFITLSADSKPKIIDEGEFLIYFIIHLGERIQIAEWKYREIPLDDGEELMNEWSFNINDSGRISITESQSGKYSLHGTYLYKKIRMHFDYDPRWNFRSLKSAKKFGGDVVRFIRQHFIYPDMVEVKP